MTVFRVSRYQIYSLGCEVNYRGTKDTDFTTGDIKKHIFGKRWTEIVFPKGFGLNRIISIEGVYHVMHRRYINNIMLLLIGHFDALNIQRLSINVTFNLS